MECSVVGLWRVFTDSSNLVSLTHCNSKQRREGPFEQSEPLKIADSNWCAANVHLGVWTLWLLIASTTKKVFLGRFRVTERFEQNRLALQLSVIVIHR
jgi:hypothetical protein